MNSTSCSCSVAQSCLTLHQAPLSMGFSRQEYWSGLPLPFQGIFQIEGLNPSLLCLLHWQLDSLPLVLLGKPCNFTNEMTNPCLCPNTASENQPTCSEIQSFSEPSFHSNPSGYLNPTSSNDFTPWTVSVYMNKQLEVIKAWLKWSFTVVKLLPSRGLPLITLQNNRKAGRDCWY